MRLNIKFRFATTNRAPPPFFFNDTPTTEIYTFPYTTLFRSWGRGAPLPMFVVGLELTEVPPRSEEHTSELQSHVNLVCRLLLEKKKMGLHASTFPSTLFTSSTYYGAINSPVGLIVICQSPLP